MTCLAIEQLIQDAKDQWDLWYAFIIGLPALAGAVLTYYGQQKSKRRWDAQDARQQIVEEVKNSHRENLRDEITRGFKEIREDIRNLRDELHTERQERIEGDRR